MSVTSMKFEPNSDDLFLEKGRGNDGSKIYTSGHYWKKLLACNMQIFLFLEVDLEWPLLGER